MNTGTAIVLGVVVLAGAALAAVMLMRPAAAPPPVVMTTQPAPQPGPGQQVGGQVDDILRIGAGIIDIVGGLFGSP